MKKKKEIVKEENKAVAQNYSLEEARAVLADFIKVTGTIEHQIKEFGEKIIPRIREGRKKGQEISNEDSEKVSRLLLAMETESHTGLVASVRKDYEEMAKELSNQIIKEYHCKTHTEKLLAEIVVRDFIWTLDSSRRFNSCLSANDSISPNVIGFLAMLSKQIDRAHRQFLSSLFALKQLKAPMIEMNIKTKNAFISQNQQINVEKQNHEINDPT